ncbi:sugar ABC transporter substrate-binding protein [Spirillospora sp. NPDC047279]|uniref:ABC transporter substrate-binding protein n=1 Tax=Spirillospora sp. NPDC047279 TaxID=3155478 RepID=UPI0033F28C38
MSPPTRRLRKFTTVLAAFALTAAACGGGGDDKEGDASGAVDEKVTITVGCMPAKSQPAQRKEWQEDVAAFQKLHPNITVVGKDPFPCADPKTFTAKLAGGQMEDVFYTYFTDVRKVVESGQAADISKYTGSIKQFPDLIPSVKQLYSDGDKLYGLPRQNYAMGLIYNRSLFTKAGLDPDRPPTTWAQAREYAKKISGLGNGTVGFAELSAGNQGGWHFTTEIYGQGGEVVTADGKKAAFNSPQGRAVLQNLQQMRWTDDSMGTKQLLQGADVQRMMAAGKVGMYVSAPDEVTALVDQFQAEYEDYGLAPMPEAKGTLLGGDGYMFNVKASPAKIKAGLLWLEYYALTPGQGQFNYVRAAANKRAVGLPQPNFYQGRTAATDQDLRAKSANVPVANYKPYQAAVTGIPGKLEPPNAQEIYATLDTVMSAVLTRRDANIDQLLADAEKKVNNILLRAN